MGNRPVTKFVLGIRSQIRLCEARATFIGNKQVTVLASHHTQQEAAGLSQPPLTEISSMDISYNGASENGNKGQK